MTIKLIVINLGVLVALFFLWVSAVHASEVTGTLSSDSGGSSQSTGGIGGTVGGGTTGEIGGTVEGNSSNSSGGSSGSSRNSIRTVSPTTLASADTTSGTAQSGVGSPSFPNAGFEPEDDDTLRSVMIIALALTALALAFVTRKKEYTL